MKPVRRCLARVRMREGAKAPALAGAASEGWLLVSIRAALETLELRANRRSSRLVASCAG